MRTLECKLNPRISAVRAFGKPKLLVLACAISIPIVVAAYMRWPNSRNHEKQNILDSETASNYVRKDDTPDTLNRSDHVIAPMHHVVVDRLDYDDRTRTQVYLQAFLDEKVSEDKLLRLLNYLYSEVSKRGPYSYRRHPNYIMIRIHAREGQGWIAMGFQSEVKSFEIQIRRELLETVNEPPVTKFGLTETQRQAIWRDIIRVERRARVEAERRFPFPMDKSDPTYTETDEENQLERQSTYADALRDRYRSELATSQGISLDQLETIGNEGVANWWDGP